MKFIALTFDYSIKNLQDIGRKWAPEVYKDKDFIFEYSAASYASFLFFNPEKKLEILTDDIFMMKEKLDKYNVNLSNISLVDWSEELKEFKKHKYAFEPLIQLIKKYKDSQEYIIKLDNDLICKKPFDLKLNNEVLVWKYERIVEQGDPRWGEKLICNTLFNNTNFRIYNVGLLGIPPQFWIHHQEYLKTCYDMIDVDISKVTDVGSEIYHCCEQTAYNWIFHKYDYNIIETYNIFEHYFDRKINCILDAKKYLK
jgi:hypothetical protein